MANRWYELWGDESALPPYVLVVMGCAHSHEIAVHDPREENRVVFRASSYSRVKLWLLEDEYTQVGERQVIDEWWDE